MPGWSGWTTPGTSGSRCPPARFIACATGWEKPWRASRHASAIFRGGTWHGAAPISPGMPLPPQPWPTGRVETLEPLVRRVLAPNGSAFTYAGTQTYLVGQGDGLAVIDPGPAVPEHLAALEQAIAGKPVLAICCTHTHRDHSPAAAPLAARTG